MQAGSLPAKLLDIGADGIVGAVAMDPGGSEIELDAVKFDSVYPSADSIPGSEDQVWAVGFLEGFGCPHSCGACPDYDHFVVVQLLFFHLVLINSFIYFRIVTH